jgi:DNA-directed RNA polymerase specialized sigma24 family protein
MTTACPPRRGDEAELYAQLQARLTKIVARQVRTSTANVEDACSFAWLQMLRYQPARETVLAWLVRVGTREAIKLDRRARHHDAAANGPRGQARRVDECRPIEAHLEVLAARDIADAKDLTPRTVERQLLRANRRLRHARERQQRELDGSAVAAAALATASR